MIIISETAAAAAAASTTAAAVAPAALAAAGLASAFTNCSYCSHIVPTTTTVTKSNDYTCKFKK